MACPSNFPVLDVANAHRLPGKRDRAGSFVVEAVVAVLLLATASLAVVRLARNSVDLQLRADRELAAALTAQNVMARLDAFTLDQLSQPLADVEKLCSEESGCEVSITALPFDRDAASGIHLRVQVIASHQVGVTLHDWRLESEGVNEPEVVSEAPESADSPSLPQDVGAQDD